MASLVIPVSVGPSPIQSYTAEEWEHKRMIITRLYRDEAKPLYMVQGILAQQYSFHPTAAMLKRRIKKWDLERNHKHADMLFALRLALEREAQGKKTIFSIRGRIVTFEDVKHYFRRKKVHDLQSLAFDTNTSRPTTQIDCRTPEPEIPLGTSATQDPSSLASSEELSPQYDFTAANINVDHSVIALPDPDQINRMIIVRSALGQVEQLLYLGQAYCDAIFDNPEWRSNHKTFNIGTLATFYYQMFDGQSLLEEGNVTKAFVHFGNAFDMVRSLLDQQVLLFLPYIYHLLLSVRHIRQQEVISQLLRFISRMATMYYPQPRPIPQSLLLLGHMATADRGESSKCVFQSVLDRLRIQFESDNIDTNTWETDPNAVFWAARADSIVDQNVDNYMLTSIAVHGLARDVDKLLDTGIDPSWFQGTHFQHCFVENNDCCHEDLEVEHRLYFNSRDPDPTTAFIHVEHGALKFVIDQRLPPKLVATDKIKRLQTSSHRKGTEWDLKIYTPFTFP